MHGLHYGLPFLSKRMKIEKVEKLVANLDDIKECYTHKKFKIRIESHISAYCHRMHKKVHRIIKFNKEAWLRPYTDKNIELRNFTFAILKIMIL